MSQTFKIARPPATPRTPIGLGPTIFAGVAIVGLFFGGIGVWAATAPLGSAVIAPGTVVVESYRKTISHLEGGIIADILVRDGDVVTNGQQLIRLDNTRAKATLDLLGGRLTTGRALEARLMAERDGDDFIDFGDSLVDRLDEKKVTDAIDGQINVFKARRAALISQIEIEESGIAQLLAEIEGLERQIRAETTQLALITDEIEIVEDLVDNGLARAPRLRELQRKAAEIDGNRGQRQASIARAKQAIAGARLRITDLQITRVNEAAEQLPNVQSELSDLLERITAAQDILARTAVIAPLDGTVVGLRKHTPGGVIAPGEPLLEIVPSGDTLVIEAQVDPADIELVYVGLNARVRLTSFSMRQALPLAGIVTSISADRLTDDRTLRDYYLARIELTDDQEKLQAGTTPYPGMPAEVMIRTGSQSALEYILKPVSDSLNRAFREE